MIATNFFKQQWADYKTVTPLANKIHSLLEARGEQVLNDHIALRTLAHPSVGVDAFANFFESMGYEQGGEYFFEEKRLRAIHLEAKEGPLIFVSEFLYEDEKFSDFLRETMDDLVAISDGQSVSELFESKRPWQPSYNVYEKLALESEYAAWLYAWGFRTNHFTVSVNALNQFDDIAKINQFLKSNDFKLNSSGGEIKGTQAEGLVQSSTMADSYKVTFLEGEKEIPSCYYEFAKRYEVNGELYRGFVPTSADKIFESTNRGAHV